MCKRAGAPAARDSSAVLERRAWMLSGRALDDSKPTKCCEPL